MDVKKIHQSAHWVAILSPELKSSLMRNQVFEKLTPGTPVIYSLQEHSAKGLGFESMEGLVKVIQSLAEIDPALTISAENKQHRWIFTFKLENK